MNVQKSAAIVAAMLITAAGMFGIANHSYAAASVGAVWNAGTTVAAVQTLPTIHVTPTPEQLRELDGK